MQAQVELEAQEANVAMTPARCPLPIHCLWPFRIQWEPSSLKRAVVLIARAFADLGFEIAGSEGTAEVLKNNGLSAAVVPKIGENGEDVLSLIERGG